MRIRKLKFIDEFNTNLINYKKISEVREVLNQYPDDAIFEIVTKPPYVYGDDSDYDNRNTITITAIVS